MGIGLPHPTCLNTLEGLGDKAEAELWPGFNRDVCLKGKNPGEDDFPLVEKHLLIPLYEKSQKMGLKLPPYKTIKPLVHSIVKDCAKKQKINFCKKADLEKMKSCAVGKLMEFIMGHLDFADKYGNEANCKMFKKIVEDEKMWDWAKRVVGNIAKTIT